MPTMPVQPTLPGAGSAAATGGAGSVGAPNFGDMVTQALDNVQSTQSAADSLSVKAATGTLADVADFMVASTKAAVTTQLTVAVRNKAVDAFNQIMQMPV
jgi:flagellar hook-basal body complex protein FliE